MQMKVHNKGQVVIPADIRRQLDIAVGDHLEVEIDPDGQRIVLKKPQGGVTYRLGGALHSYAADKPFPTKQQIEEALRDGLVVEYRRTSRP